MARRSPHVAPPPPGPQAGPPALCRNSRQLAVEASPGYCSSTWAGDGRGQLSRAGMGCALQEQQQQQEARHPRSCACSQTLLTDAQLSVCMSYCRVVEGGAEVAEGHHEQAVLYLPPALLRKGSTYSHCLPATPAGIPPPPCSWPWSTFCPCSYWSTYRLSPKASGMPMRS